MVEWIKAIEFISDYRSIGFGEGGSNEEHEYFGSKRRIEMPCPARGEI